MPEITVNTDDLLSVLDAARVLGRPRITIYRWVERGKINSIKLGGILFIPRTEVEKLVDKQATLIKRPGTSNR